MAENPYDGPIEYLGMPACDVCCGKRYLRRFRTSWGAEIYLCESCTKGCEIKTKRRLTPEEQRFLSRISDTDAKGAK